MQITGCHRRPQLETAAVNGYHGRVTTTREPAAPADHAAPAGAIPEREHICYSAAFFFMFSAVAAYMLLPLVLVGRGMSRPETGYLLAIYAAAGALTQMGIGRLSDRLGLRRPLVIAAALVLAACFAVFLKMDGFGQYAALYFFGGAAFHTAGTALAAAIADWSSEGHRTATAFARARLWGSAGYVVALIALTRWVKSDSVIVAWAAGSYLLAALAMIPARESARHTRAALELQSRASELVRDRNLAVFLVCFLLFKIAESASNAFVALRLDQLGGSRALIAWALAINAIAEIPLLGLAGPLSERIGRRPVLLVALLVLPLRMAAYASIPTAAWVFPVQLFHGLTFGFMSVASVAYVADRAPDDLRATAQGLLRMAMAAGMCIGPLAGGMVLAATNSMPALFWVLGGVVALGAAVFALFVAESLPGASVKSGGIFGRIAAHPISRMKQ